MTAKTTIVKNVTIYSTYLILVWAFYRFLFKLPDNIEELIVKPVIWLLPVFWFTAKESLKISSLGITIKNLLASIYLALGLGSIFIAEGLLTNYFKYGHFNFGGGIGSTMWLTAMGLSFATAFSEEIAFRGYIFGRLLGSLKSEFVANTIQTVLWTAIHIPIAFFVLHYSLGQGVIYLTLTALFGFGSAFIYGRTRNVAGSVLLHVLWEWPIILFR